MTQQIDPQRLIKDEDYTINLLQNALKEMDPHQPNAGQLGFIQFRLRLCEQQIQQLKSKVPPDVWGNLNQAVTKMQEADAWMGRVEGGDKSDLQSAINNLNEADQYLKKAAGSAE